MAHMNLCPLSIACPHAKLLLFSGGPIVAASRRFGGQDCFMLVLSELVFVGLSLRS